LEPQNFVMGHMTWPCPYQGQFVVHRLWLTHSTCLCDKTLLRFIHGYHDWGVVRSCDPLKNFGALVISLEWLNLNSSHSVRT